MRRPQRFPKRFPAFDFMNVQMFLFIGKPGFAFMTFLELGLTNASLIAIKPAIYLTQEKTCNRLSCNIIHHNQSEDQNCVFNAICIS